MYFEDENKIIKNRSGKIVARYGVPSTKMSSPHQNNNNNNNNNNKNNKQTHLNNYTNVCDGNQ